jgi:ribosomal protein S21
MVTVYVGDDIERGIRTFQDKIKNDDILKQLRGKEFYLSRTQRRRLKDMQSQRRLKKVQKRQEARRTGNY